MDAFMVNLPSPGVWIHQGSPWTSMTLPVLTLDLQFRVRLLSSSLTVCGWWHWLHWCITYDQCPLWNHTQKNQHTEFAINFLKLPPSEKTLILCLLYVRVKWSCFRAGVFVCVWVQRSLAWTNPTDSRKKAGFWHIFFAASTRSLADSKIFAPQTPTASHQGNLSNSFYPARFQLHRSGAQALSWGAGYVFNERWLWSLSFWELQRSRFVQQN